MKKSVVLLSLCLLSIGAYAADTQTLQTTTTTVQNTTTTTAQDPLAKGQAFLAANKTQPGVVTLPDGLQYKIITEGKGAQPTDTDTVTVDYEGKLIDGTVFDSSFKRGQPATFPVNGVIPGWTEVLKLMKVGSTWEVYIPASLAYGENGAPPVIGPNETLIFKITLLDVKKA